MMHIVLCVYVYTARSLPCGNFISAFAQWRLKWLKANRQTSLTEHAVWNEILLMAETPIIGHHLAFQADFCIFLSAWFSQERQGDNVRCFSAGFTAHRRVAQHLDRRDILKSLQFAFLRLRTEALGNVMPEGANEAEQKAQERNYRTQRWSFGEWHIVRPSFCLPTG